MLAELIVALPEFDVVAHLLEVDWCCWAVLIQSHGNYKYILDAQ